MHMFWLQEILLLQGANNNTKVAFKNCAPFRECIIEINNSQAKHINIAMPVYNLIEYSDIYSDTSGGLWQFKRDEIRDAGLTAENLSSFKYKSSLITNRDSEKNSCTTKIFE